MIGNGFTISNLKINKAGLNNQGFFGYANGATIKNTEIKNASVKSDGLSGILVALSRASNVSSCSVSGSVTSSNSYSAGIVTVALASSTIENCYANINASGKYGSGGISGLLQSGSSIENCYSAGNIYSTGEYSTQGLGGLVGKVGLAGTISVKNCYSTAKINADFSDKGALIGNHLSTVNELICENNYCSNQQENIPPMAQGTMTGNINVKDIKWFSNMENIKSILNEGNGDGKWDFSSGTPKLSWQKTSNPVDFQIGTDGSDISKITMDLNFDSTGFFIDFTNENTSRATVEYCDVLLKKINIKRASIGANSNIMDSITQGNTITNENLTASKSRIQDADIAKESANMVKNQILQNAATSLLAQSQNITGDLLLNLLNGV